MQKWKRWEILYYCTHYVIKILRMLLVSKLPKDRESSWEEYSGQIMVRMNYSLWLKNWHQCYTMTIILCHFPNLKYFFVPIHYIIEVSLLGQYFFILHFTLCACMFMIHQCEHFCFGCSCLEIEISCQIKSVSS